MLEITKKEFPVKIGDETFIMKSPSYINSVQYSESLKSCDGDAVKSAECLFDYLEILGLPKKQSVELEMSEVTQILDYVLGQKKN